MTGCHLFGFWLCMLVSWNVPFGPDREDLRYHELRDCLKVYFSRKTPKSAVLFQELAPKIIAEHEASGVTYPGLAPVDEECWQFLSARQFFAKVGRRTNLNRFLGSIEAAGFNLPQWHTDLLERSVCALEKDMLKGSAFMSRFSLKAGQAEQVTDGGNSTSCKRLQLEDVRCQMAPEGLCVHRPRFCAAWKKRARVPRELFGAECGGAYDSCVPFPISLAVCRAGLCGDRGSIGGATVVIIRLLCPNFAEAGAGIGRCFSAGCFGECHAGICHE